MLKWGIVLYYPIIPAGREKLLFVEYVTKYFSSFLMFAYTKFKVEKKLQQLKLPDHWNRQAVKYSIVVQYSKNSTLRTVASCKMVVKICVICSSLWFAQYMACIPMIDIVQKLRPFFTFKQLPGTEACVLEA